ncbi:uncharacterized protein [Typha angustifolia]|uniref:uncharacterized protein isoform X2 n=1 Tax=Typha angustifolia TaxID=59011 RepID=UPI003C2C98B0
MAYRRKNTITRSATFVEDSRSFRDDPDDNSPSSLAAKAMRASSSSYAYRQDPITCEYTSMKSLNEPKHGFWGILAKKAKELLEDNGDSRKFEDYNRDDSQLLDSSPAPQESPAFQKGSEAINYIGGRIRNALEEGRTIVENRTADIFQETRKLQIGRKPSNSNLQFQNPTDQETQLKVSRNVANAMAAKAKLLMRELKTVKADMAFTKERCSQLEDENKILRESRQKGDHNADDDLIRLQLETLLAEKARLAHENSIYARENRFLREIVEYHQLNMQDVVSLAGDDDDDIEEEVEEMLSSPVLSSPRSPTANSYQPSYPSPRTSVAAGSPTSSNSPRHDVLEKRQGDGEEEEEEVSLSPISKNSPTSLA